MDKSAKRLVISKTDVIFFRRIMEKEGFTAEEHILFNILWKDVE